MCWFHVLLVCVCVLLPCVIHVCVLTTLVCVMIYGCACCALVLISALFVRVFRLVRVCVCVLGPLDVCLCVCVSVMYVASVGPCIRFSCIGYGSCLRVCWFHVLCDSLDSWLVPYVASVLLFVVWAGVFDVGSAC